MSVKDVADIETELVVAVRNGNVLSQAERGVVNFSGGQSADGVTTTFFLGAAGSPLRNIRGVWVSGIGHLKDGVDYTANYYTGSITFTSPPPSGESGIWRIDYDYGPSEKIYPDYPRLDLTLSSYPRVSVILDRWSSSPLGIGATHLVSDMVVDVWAFAPTASGVNDILAKVRNQFAVSGTKLHNVKCVIPQTLGPLGVEPGRHQKIVQRSQTFQIIKEVESV